MARIILDLMKEADAVVKDLGLGDHRAFVAMIADISGSTETLYHNHSMQEAIERAAAIGLTFDIGGRIEVFPFQSRPFHADPVTIDNVEGYTDRMIRKFPVNGGTVYSQAIWHVALHYFPQLSELPPYSGACAQKPGFFAKLFGAKEKLTRIISSETPVFVFFITDGDCNTDDYEETIRVLTQVSVAPIFFQFYGIGRGPFSFLKQLDTMDGRFVDNANFQALLRPTEIGDRDFFREYVLPEYPSWISKSEQLGLLRR